MLTYVTAREFVRPAKNGRTGPVLLVCDDATGDEVELFAKLSARCEQGAANLAKEVLAACLAGDLGLPIPQPFLVNLPGAWVATIPNIDIRSAMIASVPVAFGSKIAGPQYAPWNAGIPLRPEMAATALAIFTFDALIANSDRREGNPNCLVLGDNFRIIDHEMAFPHSLPILGWRPPWQPGALDYLTKPPGKHIFHDKLRKLTLDIAPLRAAWSALSDAEIDGYAAALPAEWTGAAKTVAAAIRAVKEARDHIDSCLTEIQRVLT
jgi:hypothetical protein